MDVSALMKEPQSLGVEALFKDSSSDESSSIYHDTYEETLFLKKYFYRYIQFIF